MVGNKSKLEAITLEVNEDIGVTQVEELCLVIKAQRVEETHYPSTGGPVSMCPDSGAKLDDLGLVKKPRKLKKGKIRLTKFLYDASVEEDKMIGVVLPSFFSYLNRSTTISIVPSFYEELVPMGGALSPSAAINQSKRSPQGVSASSREE